MAARATLHGLLEPLELADPGEALPAWLLPHQADAARRCRAILHRFGGVLLADGVGVGKTLVALALALLERAGGGGAAAIVPAALKLEWQRECRAVGLRLPLYTHTRLARSTPALPPGISLLLVDEAHAFRNAATRRYAALADLAAGRRVVLLTATPFNNSPADLAALLQLFCGRDRFRELGVADLREALHGAGGPAGAGLALSAISVCRSRRLVRERFPDLDTAFPHRRLAAPVAYDLLRVYAGRLDPLLRALGQLAASAPDLAGGAALFHLALLRRLESSRAALVRSLRRHHEFLLAWSDAAASGRRLTRRDFTALFPRHDGDETQLSLLELLLGEAGAAVPEDLTARRAALDDALRIAAAPTEGDDPKRAALEALLAGELAGRRTIVFTEYRDTALDLARSLRRRFRVLAVTGRDAWAGPERLSRRRALDAFAPVSRAARSDPLLEARVLIATDVASEGMNLQDASAVVNYDLPWNPVRVMQRIGRVDRLGALSRDVVVAHLVPAGGLRELTGVLETLRAKLARNSGGPGAEPDPLAALWWTAAGLPTPAALETESWRRIEPFEAGERWRTIAGPPPATPARRPVVAAGLAEDGAPAVGLLLALEWPTGARIPLAYVMSGGGDIRADPVALGTLAARALRATPLPCAPPDFSAALASVLPLARARLLALSAARRGGNAPGPNRRTALTRLSLAALRAGRARDAAAVAAIAAALEALRHDLPAGLERRLGRLLQSGASGRALATQVQEQIAPALPPRGPALDGTPRLVLVAAIALASRSVTR